MTKRQILGAVFSAGISVIGFIGIWLSGNTDAFITMIFGIISTFGVIGVVVVLFMALFGGEHLLDD